MNRTKKNMPADYNPVTEGDLGREILKYSLPIFIGTLLQTLYSTVDVIVLGRFVGKEAFAAVGGSTMTIVNLLVGFFVGISSGATVLIAQKFGAKDEKGTSDAIHTAAAFAITASCFLTIVGEIAAEQALVWMQTPADIMPYALVYLRIYFLGIIFNLIYNIGSAILRALGDSKRPLYILAVCSASNIVIDLIMVLVFHLDSAGVAIATIGSQAISSVMIVWILAKSRNIAKLSVRKIRFHGYILKPMMRIGIPAGIQSSMFSVAHIICQYTVNTFGTDVVAAYTAYRNIDGMLWMVLNAFGIAASTFVGQNLGAGKRDRAFRTIRITVLYAFFFELAMTGLVLLFRGPVSSFFTTDEAVIKICSDMMLCAFPFYIFYVLIEVLSGAIRGAGDSVVPMFITCIGICVVRVTWLTVMVPIVHHYNTIAFCYPVTWVVTGLAYLIYYKTKRWLRYFPEKKETQETTA